MDLLLWRHAEAVDSLPDSTRELTERGIRQAHKVAAWLESRRPKKLRVLVSPTVRTRQTASAFTKDFEIVPALGPGNDISGILGACGWPDGGGSVLVVGHQPELGRLASLLLSAMKPTGRSKRAHCGGSPTGFGETRRKPCCAPSCRPIWFDPRSM
jgi:phosphohistidine phosphatase